MKHIHKRFPREQVKIFLAAYTRGRMTRKEVEEELDIGKTRFFALLKRYRKDPMAFSVSYHRFTPSKLPDQISIAIEQGLLFEKELIRNPDIPLTTYNYSALRDRLKEKQEIDVSLTTIIRKAKELDCYRPKRKRAIHDREVLTTAIGALIQHDSSDHQWSPYAHSKWKLITSLDDFSRMLLYADFVSSETTWTHMEAVRDLAQTYGYPLRYYVDQLRVFRFVQGRDSIWRKHILQTDDVDPQWRKMMRILGVDVIYALSPQAKGKIERPYRWLQDRIVRTCALENITTINDARTILKQEVQRYNMRQVHSATGEIPVIRFAKAKQEGNSLFRPFSIPKPYESVRDIFCLREKRTVNAYHKVSLFNQEIFVPKVPLREEVDILMALDTTKEIVDLRFWWNNQLVHTATYPIKDFPVVHF